MTTNNNLLPPDGIPSIESVQADLDRRDRDQDRRHLLGAVGLGIVAVGLVAGDVLAQRYGIDGRLSHTLPFLAKAQEAINNVDDTLVPVGEYGIPAAIGFVASVKALAPFKGAARFADGFSAREPSADGSERKRRFGGIRRRVGMAMAGASLATFTAGIATEVGRGPDRPIDAFDALVPGNSVVVQYKEAMPMVQSSLNVALAQQIRKDAAKKSIPTHAFGLNLGTYEYKGHAYTDLFAGVETNETSPVHWNGANCNDVPVILDSASGVPRGAKLSVNGISVQVVGTTERTSSMNRVSGIIDEKALTTCLEQDSNKPPYGMTMETDPDTAQQLVDEAHAETGLTAPAAVITKDQEKQNSELFWDANVKPITSVLSFAAIGLAGMAMASAMGSRLLRNRRELGARLAAGVSVNTLRLAEIVRATKDGVVAGVGGAIVGIPLAIIPNAIQQGFDAGAGVREAAVGMAVGLAGSVGGAAFKLRRLREVANPEETTRI